MLSWLSFVCGGLAGLFPAVPPGTPPVLGSVLRLISVADAPPLGGFSMFGGSREEPMTHWFLSVTTHYSLLEACAIGSSRETMLMLIKKRAPYFVVLSARFVRVPRDRAPHNACWKSRTGPSVERVE